MRMGPSTSSYFLVNQRGGLKELKTSGLAKAIALYGLLCRKLSL